MNVDWNAWGTGFASFIGGAGFVGLLRYVIRNKEITLSNEAALRKELQAQITSLNERILHLETEREELQRQYNELYKMNADLRALLKKEGSNGQHTLNPVSKPKAVKAKASEETKSESTGSTEGSN